MMVRRQSILKVLKPKSSQTEVEEKKRRKGWSGKGRGGRSTRGGSVQIAGIRDKKKNERGRKERNSFRLTIKGSEVKTGLREEGRRKDTREKKKHVVSPIKL